jgi:hypothetical protein
LFTSLCQTKYKEENKAFNEWATHIYNSSTDSFNEGHYFIGHYGIDAWRQARKDFMGRQKII